MNNTIYQVKNHFHKIVVELFKGDVTENSLQSYIELLHKDSGLQGPGFYSELIHAIPFNKVGCNFKPERKDAILKYCKSKIQIGKTNETKISTEIEGDKKLSYAEAALEIVFLIKYEGKPKLTKNNSRKLWIFCSY